MFNINALTTSNRREQNDSPINKLLVSMKDSDGDGLIVLLVVINNFFCYAHSTLFKQHQNGLVPVFLAIFASDRLSLVFASCFETKVMLNFKLPGI